MRKLLLILAIITTTFSFAQNSQFGIKAGINYNFSGDLTDLGEITDAADDVIHGADSKTGYHAGIWYKLNYSDLFLKGELLYTQFENTYGGTPSYTMTTKKIDVPVLVGMKVFGPVYIFGGPDFQYIMDEDFSLSTTEVTTDDFTLGLHVGVGLEFKRISFDLRWDKALSSNNLEFVNENFTLDNRPNQLMFSLNYSFSKVD
jgi:hypothetical protein